MNKIAMKGEIEKYLKIKYGVGIKEAKSEEFFLALSSSLIS